MSLENALVLMTRFLGLTMFLQGLELFALTRRKEFFQIWSDQNLLPELRKGLPVPNGLVDLFFSMASFRGVILLQILAAAACCLTPSASVIAVLFFTQLIICIRFRGTFNGGSDMMLFVVITGLFFSLLPADPRMQKWGLIYIAIHTLYSYFKAGLAKIIRREWRRGHALSAFLERSLFPDMRLLGAWLRRQKILSWILCWVVLIFELSAIFLPLAGPRILHYFAAAIVFHLTVFFCFGLNRFFWAWLCAWPAVFYTLALLHA